MGAWSRKSLKRFPEKLPFWKKRPLTGKFSKIRSDRIYRDTDPRILCKFREIWLTGSRWNRALFTGQKNFRSLSLLRRSRPFKFQRVSRLGSVTARHSSSGRQQTAGWTEGATYIRQATITLGIDPLASSDFRLYFCLRWPWINKYRLLIDHTSRNRYSTVDVYAPDF